MQTVGRRSIGQSSVYCVAPEILRIFAAEVTAIVANVPVCSTDGQELGSQNQGESKTWKATKAAAILSAALSILP